MEPSQVVGDKEECNSSESGWTKYLASPMSISNEDDSGNEEVSDDVLEDDDGGDTSDSEDSMASDASSGPAHLETTSYSNANNVIGVSKSPEEEEKEEVDDSEEEDVGKLVKRCSKGKKGRGRTSGK